MCVCVCVCVCVSELEINGIGKIQQNSTHPETGYPVRQLSGSVWSFVKIYGEFYKTDLPSHYQLSDQVQYSVMASGTSYQAWAKGFRSRYILSIVTAGLQTANVVYFQRKIQLSGFSAYPDGSPSQLIRIN